MPVIDPPRLLGLFRSAPFSRRFGLKLVSASAGRAVVVLDAVERHTQGLGRVHGGAVTALADTAATFAGYAAVGGGAHLLTTGLSMSFLKGASPGDRLTARAKLVHEGRRTLVAEVDVVKGRGTVIAIGLFTMLRVDEEPGRGARPALRPGAARSSRRPRAG
jgi:uncharacterized protein (TIGR00369 family)